MKKVMVVGSGGREHALVLALRKSPAVSDIFVLPGNGGIARDAVCVPIAATDLDAMVAFACEKQIDFAVVAPDDPLVLGAVDALEARGIRCFGPRKNAAIIEGSKIFAKNLMKKYNIPTARYEVFYDIAPALAYLRTAPIPTVVKADGLALGKGVVICETREAARAAVLSMMEDKKFGESGAQIVMEEFLQGPEVSVLSFTDGETIVPMVSSMDHKRALDGDRGPNTGGMGTIAPNPCYTQETARRCMREIFLPTIRAMQAEGRPFKGCLYFGLMLTADGPKVIEYNCRFGDPEAQVVLPLLESDLFTILNAVADGTLTQTEVRFSGRHACCVILASEGYPGTYEKGKPFTIDDSPDSTVYCAGVREQNGALVTDGGRVAGVTATGDTLCEAIEKAYRETERVHFSNQYCRKDIGRLAISC